MLVKNIERKNICNNISIFAHNVNGLLTKMSELYAEVDAADFDIYLMTETRLKSQIISSNLFPPNFETYRCDRSDNTSYKEGGGGVLISVDKKFNSELILSGESNGCEQIWIKIKSKSKNLFLGVLYIPPNSCTDLYLRHSNIIKNVCDLADIETTVALYGDFNMPMIKWTQSDICESTYFAINITNQIEHDTIDSFSEIALMQINYILNDNNRILDLVWTNEPDVCFCKICDDNILTNESHHKALNIEIEFKCDVDLNAEKEYYNDYANANYDEINNEICSIDWCSILNANNTLQFKTDLFYSIINKIIEKHVEIKEVKRMNNPVWFDKVAINMKNRINRLHKKMKLPHNHNIKETYKNIKRDYTHT